MGSGRWDSRAWAGYTTANYGTSDRSTLRSSAAVKGSFSSGMDPQMDPAKWALRESRDSDDNPNSTAIMLFTDVTGSMGHLSQEILSAMDTVCTELYDRKPVTDPHIMTGAIGDAYYDSAPIQASQFEADIRIAEQTRRLYIEHGGGGNYGESYALPWLLASDKTSIDCFEKRGQKGFLFTVGDEPLLGAERLKSHGGSSHSTPWAVTKDQAKEFLDLDLEKDYTAEEIFGMASRQWEIIHICVSGDDSPYRPGVMSSFGEILGDRLLFLQDTALLPELIVSSIQVIAGHDKDAVAKSWGDDDATRKISSAIKDLVPVEDAGADAGGVVAL